MNINLDIVPSTVCQAVDLIVASLTTEERKLDPSAMHHDLGMTIRSAWSLWERDTPLKRDAVTNYGIAHPDDISGLILAWASALVRNEPFVPLEHCQSYYEHWKALGTDALAAGGWPPPNLGNSE